MSARVTPTSSKGLKQRLPRSPVSLALGSGSRWVLFFNLALVLLIAIVWWMILKPEPKAAPVVSTSTPVTTAETPAVAQTPTTTAPTPTPAPTKPTGETYTVASGDSLASIGTKLGVEWHKIADANNIKEPFALQIGQVLIIPR